MADAQGKWTYDDGYTLINMISGDCHYAQLGHYQQISDWFSTGIFKVMHIIDVFGAKISIRTERIESVEEQSPLALSENDRANDFARKNPTQPSWLDS